MGPGLDYKYSLQKAESLEEYCRVAKEVIADEMKQEVKIEQEQAA